MGFTMTTAAKTVDTTSTTKRHSMFGDFIDTVKFALVLGFLVSLGVNLYYWGAKGYHPTINKITNVAAHENEAIAARSQDAAGFFVVITQRITKWINSIIHYAEHNTPSIQLTTSLKPNQNERTIWHNFKIGWHKFWSILFGTAVEVLIKLISIFASFFVYVFALLLGAVDGLVQREIRRAEGGRESTFLFHKVADTVLKIPGLILIVFLACPIPINPLIAVYSITFMFFCFSSILCTNWKKNL